MTRRVRFTPFLATSLFVAAASLGPRVAEAGDVPFSAQPPIATPVGDPRSVFAADVDGDGDVDALSASRTADRIAWYENTAGDGSLWTTHTISLTADGAVSVFAADVDGDGDTDVLSASRFDNKIAWYENTAGDGSLWTLLTISTAANAAFAVSAADVDGDGDTDVLSASYGDDKIAWYENTAGDGSAWTTRTISLTANGARSVFPADVDGDGDMDVLSASYADDKIAWYENTAGDGSLWTLVTISLTADFTESVSAADVDGDGDVDALSASRYDDKVAWYENTAGDGSSWSLVTISLTADEAVSVVAADVDGDGDVDVLSASFADDKIAWYENTAGDGSLWTDRTISLTAGEAFSAFVADVDGDGDLDALSATRYDDRINWYRNDSIHSSACFTTPPPISTTATGAFAVVGADVDGDGDTDALSASGYDLKIAWYENSAGDGSAWTLRTISTAVDAVDVVAADVDGDGDTDALSASMSDNKIAWHENVAGNGTAWTLRTITTGALVARAVFAADVDGDGDIDALSASSYQDKVAWYENTAGNGTAWTTHTISLLADFAYAVAAADVDGDGDTDALSTSINDNKVAWYENTAGNGSVFTLRTISTAVSQADAVAAADVDGDGDTDVLSGSAVNQVSWHENTAGNGSTWTLHPISAAGSAASVASADVDGDGDIDALSASLSGPVVWHENTAGNGSSWSTHTIVVDGNPRSVFAADVDQDGDVDALSARDLGNTVAWHRDDGGQFSLAATDTAPPTAANGALVSMLRIDGTHLGRAGDHDLELASLGLLFEESAGDPLTSAEANALIESLRVYRDANGNGVFDPASDVLVVSLPTLALTGGVQTVTLADGDPEVQVSFGTPKTYFVVVELTGNANQQSPDQFRVTHLGLGPSASTAQDRSFDIPLRPACPADVSSSIRQAVPVELQRFTVE